MVVKTDKCAFSEFVIFPGHGIKCVKRDGTPLMLISRKARSLMQQRKKPAKLTWTMRWRILNKKGKVEEGGRKRTRKTVKVQRAIVGTSAADIIKMRVQKPELRSAQREAALKEVKDRNKAAKAEKVKAKVSAASKAKETKTKGTFKNARAGAKR
mmetsp:Transcript_18927/g.63956  ORF Transcript_18927/g.63956 Transcript_18927/m.63956 type:complete len:155 (-) Transcript_18927:43-507(-)